MGKFFPEVNMPTWWLLYLYGKLDKHEGKLQIHFREEQDTVGIFGFGLALGSAEWTSAHLPSSQPADLKQMGLLAMKKKSQDPRSEHVCKVHHKFSEWSYFPHNNKYFYNL